MFEILSLFSADGRWYHRNHGTAYNGKEKLKYTITAEIDGKTVESKGKIHPGPSIILLLIRLFQF